MNPESKRCPTCNEFKTLDQFGKRAASPDGHYYKCKLCKRAAEDASYKANREKRLTACSEYYQKNKARISEKGKKYREKVHDRIVAYRKTEKNIYSVYKSGAKKRDLDFDLTFDQFMSFWQQDCSYCKRPIPTIGIDRVDSNIGYSLENCVSCCSICNCMKLDHSLEEWQTNMLMALKGMGVI